MLGVQPMQNASGIKCGASDLIVEIFGEAGKHARADVGAGSLPRNSSVEIDER